MRRERQEKTEEEDRKKRGMGRRQGKEEGNVKRGKHEKDGGNGKRGQDKV